MIYSYCFKLLIRFLNTFTLNITGNQAVSLRSFPLFRSAVPVGQPYIFIRTLSVNKLSIIQFNSLVSLRSTDTSQHKKNKAAKKGSLIFSAVRSSSSHALSLRSVGLMHPQYSFITFRFPAEAGTLHCIPAVLCLPPSVFSAVAPSHSHRGWLRSVKNLTLP